MEAKNIIHYESRNNFYDSIVFFINKIKNEKWIQKDYVALKEYNRYGLISKKDYKSFQLEKYGDYKRKIDIFPFNEICINE